jgi:hypothetical protein
VTCPWDPDEPTVEEELERGWLDITRYLEGRTPMTPYRDRHEAGEYTKPDDEPKAEAKSTAKSSTKKPSKSK